MSFNFSNVNISEENLNVNTTINLKNNGNLTVLYSNVDCLTHSKKLELECLLSENRADIVALTEIYPKNSIFENIENVY